MNKNFTILIFLSICATLFSSCSRYTYYWHEEEDDVYFVSDTPEVVDIEIYERDIDDDDDEWEDSRQRRSEPDFEPRPRQRRGNNRPIIILPPRNDRRTSPRRTPPRTEPSRPAPSRRGRPAPGRKPPSRPQ